MYHYLKGELIEKSPTHAVVEVSGVAYFLNISLNSSAKLSEGTKILIYTHLVVREDAQLLYGFVEEKERNSFRYLLSVSGVGANTARVILSSMTPLELESAILSEDIAAIKAVKGIGAKSAQRIILDLKDKIIKGEGVENFTPTNNKMGDEALNALLALGFNKASVQKILTKIKSDGQEYTLENLIKEALKQL